MLGKEYFKTHDGHGIFVHEGAGRLEILGKGDAKAAPLPPELQAHMKFLFEMFDTDQSGAGPPSTDHTHAPVRAPCMRLARAQAASILTSFG